MGQEPRHLAALESARLFFGAELRHWRDVRGLSQQRLGDLSHDSRSLIAKVEKGERIPSSSMAHRLDRVLDTGGALHRIWVQIEREQAKRGLAAQSEASDTVDDSLGLEWSPTTASTVGTVAGLWRADMQRRQVIVDAAWAAAALVDPARRWLTDAVDRDTSHNGGRRIGRSEVEVMWSMCRSFADADHHLGGGYARSTLIQFMDQRVSPMLAGTYDAETGRQLFTAAARLCDLGGFMCFDSSRQGLGQRYYIQALRLAKASGDRTLGAHILGDMSLQAYDLGRPSEALALAEAGHCTARDCGSPSTAARCSALQARAHGLAGDQAATARAMKAAERELNQADLDDEPFWIRFFTEEQLAAEFMYTAHDLGQTAEVQLHAPTVLQSSAGMQRREVLATSTLAASYLPTKRNPSSGRADVDMACKVLTDALPSAAASPAPAASPRSTPYVVSLSRSAARLLCSG
ncbi:helix-turn-helix domain-containing protein [Kribbella sp. VKM Ac-2568]|uniref:helix-turn-helix domain-containing protein n=1 Tax=Kribbella sp. VKM Ac-2568 TaxID=2512219 RepID=UPI0010E4BEBA|nr:helix-turn-helix transcriptional regulator [Kribbella sp. VKM Ac-2568]TCM49426.1 helix-turn-helix protein [Kribbella sp. VKM Ac-2568]